MAKRRRDLLKQSTQLGVSWIAMQLLGSTTQCNLTPQQTEGPFYPIQFPIDDDNDLTWIKDKNQAALGEKIIIFGKVFNTYCQPLENVEIEIWQACHSGRYNHEYDPNQAILDPNFQYWGKTKTDPKGSYAFKTIKPGGYPVTSYWQRPPHIHFKVTAFDQPRLTTQLYFAEEQELNQKDRILQRIPLAQQSFVITQLVKNSSLDIRISQFDIILGDLIHKNVTPSDR